MPKIELKLPFYLPDFLYQKLRGLKRTTITNLSGDRDIEYSWIISRLPTNKGEVLDFGCGPGHLALLMARLGFNVMAIDLQSNPLNYVHPKVIFIQGDILDLQLPDNYFELVINCSTVEHVGLVGRYGVTEKQTNGDLKAMKKLRKFMKKGGDMLLTIPVGHDAVFDSLHRVYGKKRLSRLLNSYIVEEQEYWVKDEQNLWKPSSKETALNFKPSWNINRKVYGLGLFKLKKP